MSKSVIIIPDAVASIRRDNNWYHPYQDHLQANGHQAMVDSPPDDSGRRSMQAWQDTRAPHIREGLAGKDAVIVGHGLGGLALLRFLEQQEEPIGSAIFVGAPMGLRPLVGTVELEAFNGGFDFDWESIKTGAESFSVIHGYDDPEIPMSNGVELARMFGGAPVSLVYGAGHFNTPGDNDTLLNYLPVSDASLSS